MQRQSFKRDKLSEKILQDANVILRSEFKDPRLQFVSFTRIHVNDDYSLVNLYWDTYNLEEVENVKSAMEKVPSKIRSHMARTLKMRSIPFFKVFYDSQFVDENRISELLKEEASSQVNSESSEGHGDS